MYNIIVGVIVTECLPYNFALWEDILRQSELDNLVLYVYEAVARVNQFLKVLGIDWLKYLQILMQFSRLALSVNL